jgi:predicted ATP-dependent protease
VYKKEAKKTQQTQQVAEDPGFDEENCFDQPVEIGKDAPKENISEILKPPKEEEQKKIEVVEKKETTEFVPKEKKPAQRFEPKDTIFVFLGTLFLYIDFKKEQSEYGSCSTVYNDPLEVGENCSILRVSPEQCSHSTVFVTGGVCKVDALLNWAFGLQFLKDDYG